MALITGVLEERILRLRLSDPSSRNALSLLAARELRTLIAPKNFDAILLYGDERVFCSGGNLSDYAAMPEASQGLAVNREIRAVLGELASVPVPTVCAVGGDAFGGGVELISCFDHVIAASHVVFGLWQRKIGLSFGWGGGVRLQSRVGEARLRELSVSTRTFGAQEALEIGMLDAVVSSLSLEGAALRAAHRLSALPKNPVAVLKNESLLEDEVKLFESLWWNEEHKRALAPRKPLPIRTPKPVK